MKLKILRFLDIAVEYSVYGLIFFIPISIAMMGSFAGFVLTFFLLKKIISPDFSSIKDNKALFLFLLLFFAFMDLSLLNSGPLVVKSLKVLIIKWGRFPLLLWAVVDTFRDPRRIIKALYVILFSAALVGLSVFTQKFFGFEFLRGRGTGGFLSSITGPFKNPNALAAYLTCVIPIVLSLALWKWKKAFIKAGLFLISAILVIFSLWTLSRGGWLGAISGLIFIILIVNYQRIRKVFWPLFLTSYIFFVPLIGLILFFFQNRRDSYRFVIFRGAWEMIKEHPLLGKGVGTFMDYCVLYAKTDIAYYAHNCYLQMWAESGIFSLLSFLLFVGYVFYRSIKVILEEQRSLKQLALIGLTSGLLGFLVHSFFEVHLYSFQLSFLFWIVLGLTVALSAILEQVKQAVV